MGVAQGMRVAFLALLLSSTSGIFSQAPRGDVQFTGTQSKTYQKHYKKEYYPRFKCSVCLTYFTTLQLKQDKSAFHFGDHKVQSSFRMDDKKRVSNVHSEDFIMSRLENMEPEYMGFGLDNYTEGEIPLEGPLRVSTGRGKNVEFPWAQAIQYTMQKILDDSTDEIVDAARKTGKNTARNLCVRTLELCEDEEEAKDMMGVISGTAKDLREMYGNQGCHRVLGDDPECDEYVKPRREIVPPEEKPKKKSTARRAGAVPEPKIKQKGAKKKGGKKEL